MSESASATRGKEQELEAAAAAAAAAVEAAAEGEVAAATEAAETIAQSAATNVEEAHALPEKPDFHHMAGYLKRPNKKGGDWVKRWVEIGVPVEEDPTGFADNMCCYKSKDKKKLLNSMKMYAATNIRLSTEADKEGVFLIEVSKKDYPFMAETQESARRSVK